MLLAQIGVGFVDPIGARRGEDVEVDGIFEGLGLVGHMGRDAEDLPGAHGDGLSADDEVKRTFENVGDLLVVVAVHGYDAAFAEEDAGEHHLLANDELAVEQGIQLFEFDVIPTMMSSVRIRHCPLVFPS